MNRSQNQTRTRTNTQRFHREGSGPGVPATDAALAVEGASVRMRMLAGAQTFGGPVTRPACISRALRARSRCGTYKRGRGLEVRVHLLKLMCRRGLRRTTAAGRRGHCLRSTHLTAWLDSAITTTVAGPLRPPAHRQVGRSHSGLGRSRPGSHSRRHLYGMSAALPDLGNTRNQ